MFRSNRSGSDDSRLFSRGRDLCVNDLVAFDAATLDERGIHAASARVSSERGVSLTRGHRDDVGADRRIKYRWHLNASGVGAHFDQLAVGDPALASGLRIDLDPASPNHAGHRIGQLLKHWQMRLAA